MILSERRMFADPDFRLLCQDLDREFEIRYPDSRHNFEPYNKVGESAQVIVAYSGIIPVGCGCFRPTSTELEVEIKRMYVVPAYRGRGISRIVLTDLEQWARSEGYTNAKLETGIRQPEAIGLYSRLGYTTIPNYPPYEGVAESICMAKVL